MENLEKELKQLQKKAEAARKKKSLKQQIWVLKHPRLVAAGEKTRGGLSRLRVGVQAGYKQMKEREIAQAKAQQKANKGKPQQSYSDRLNKAFGGY